MFELAFTTGMRPGERYGLMPYQLELHHGIPVINVCQQAKPIPVGATIPDWMEAEHLDGAIWLTKPKTAKGVRTVPIPQGLWDRLWAHIVKWGVPSHGLVFTNLYGHPIRRDNEEKRWRRALKMAGLPYVDIYSARHWLATELAAAGASDEERTAIMGHTDIHTTSVYTHWRERRLAKTLDAALPDLRDGQ